MIRRSRTIERGALSLFAALLLACASTSTEGYVPFREDAAPEPEAKAECLGRSTFRDKDNLEWTDWNQFADCMEEHGLRRP